MKRFLVVLVLFFLFAMPAGVVYAQVESGQGTGQAAAAQAVPAVDTGDTAWLIVATALVMLMTPGLAFFYGGMVGKKNVLGILMQCFTILCLVSVQWVLFGYSLSFGPGKGFWGGFEWLGLKGVGLTPYADYAATIPHQLFMAFQMMFAIITPAHILGAFAERMKFSAFVLFTILWATSCTTLCVTGSGDRGMAQGTRRP